MKHFAVFLVVFAMVGISFDINSAPPTIFAQDDDNNIGLQIPLNHPYAPFLESRAYAASLGATNEFRKMEWVTIDQSNNRLYMSMTDIGIGMSDGIGDIQLDANPCGIVYTAQLDASMNMTQLEPAVVGGPYNSANAPNACALNNIASPDGLDVDARGRLWIAEDTGNHENNMIWVYDPTNNSLKRFGYVPLGAEVAGIHITAHGTLFINYQHPAATNTPPYNVSGVGIVKNFNANTDDFVSIAVPTGNAKQILDIAAGEYQLLGRTGDAIPNAPNGASLGEVFDINGVSMFTCTKPDGNAFVPSNAEGTAGSLYTNYECRPGAVSRINIQQMMDGSWSIVDGNMLDFSGVRGAWNNCGFSLSPWNSVLSAEEFEPAANNLAAVAPLTNYLNTQANPYDYGWMIEISSNANGNQIDKHYAMGRKSNESAEIASDNRTVYFGDDGTDVVIFKFVADVVGDLSSGTLYAAEVTQIGGPGANHSFQLNWLELGTGSDSDIETAIRALDIPPIVSLSPAQITHDETQNGVTTFDFTVTLSTTISATTTVTYTINDGTATIADADYIDNDHTLTFNPGDPLIQNITVEVNGDIEFEADEYFTVKLNSSTNSTIDFDSNYALGTITNDDVGTPNDSLVLFNPGTNNTGIYDTVLDNPDEYAYLNTPPTNIAPEWVMGDWNGNGQKTPGYFDSGVFRYTNDIGPSSNWSAGWWFGFAGTQKGIVAGRFDPAFNNDCFGLVDGNLNGAGNMRFSLKYWCDMTVRPQDPGGGPLLKQWLGAPLSNTAGFVGTHQWIYGDWDNDNLDEPAVRRGGRIARSNSAPSEGSATFGIGAQRWDTADGDGPGTHGLDDGLFVAGDWNGDGVDTWGVVYDDDTFYYRDVFGFNPGPFEFSLQTFTSSIATPRQVDSHHNATGGSSAPGPAGSSILRIVEDENFAGTTAGGNFDTSQNVEAELSVSKVGNYTFGEVGLIGDTIVWTITIRNIGTAPANSVQITDTVPSELRVADTLSDNGIVTVHGQSVIFTAGSIGVGETAQFQVVTTILNQPASGTFANSVNVVLPDGKGGGSDANLVASGTVLSVNGLPATGYAPQFRW